MTVAAMATVKPITYLACVYELTIGKYPCEYVVIWSSCRMSVPNLDVTENGTVSGREPILNG